MNDPSDSESNGVKNSLLNNKSKANQSTIVTMKRITKKILLLGYNDAGKSSLAIKFMYDHFPNPNNHSVIEENYKKIIKNKKENIELNIVDSPSIDQYSMIIPQKHSFGVNGYIFVFSITNKESYETIVKLKNDLNKINGRDLPSVLIGNKLDLAQQRKVKYDEAENFANKYDMPYLEISTKNDPSEKIEKVFKTIINEIYKSENPSSFNPYQFFNLRKVKDKNRKRFIRFFQYTNILTILLGIFFILFGAINTVLAPSFIMKNGVILFVMLAIGLMMVLISIFGFFGVKYDNLEYLKIFLVLSPIEFIVEILGIVFIEDFRAGNTSAEKYIEKFEPYILGFLIFAMVLQVFLFIFAFITKYFITIKKKLIAQSKKKNEKPQTII